MMVNTMIANCKYHIQFYVLSIVLFFKEFAYFLFRVLHHYIFNTTQEEINNIYFFTVRFHKIHSKNYYLSITADKSNLTYQNISNYNAALRKRYFKKIPTHPTQTQLS